MVKQHGQGVSVPIGGSVGRAKWVGPNLLDADGVVVKVKVCVYLYSLVGHVMIEDYVYRLPA